MFLMGLIFLLLLLLSFAVIWLITRQTATERTIEERIANLHNSQKENAVVDPECGCHHQAQPAQPDCLARPSVAGLGPAHSICDC